MNNEQCQSSHSYKAPVSIHNADSRSGRTDIVHILSAVSNTDRIHDAVQKIFLRHRGDYDFRVEFDIHFQIYFRADNVL
jgi:hypothetical protein